MIKTVQIGGFKSFPNPPSTIELSKLNFLVGANAAGKTNFLAALRFLKNALEQDVTYALNDLGGAEEVIPKAASGNGSSGRISIGVEMDDVHHVKLNNTEGEYQFKDFGYRLSVEVDPNGEGSRIVEETLTATVVENGEEKPYSLRRDIQEVLFEDPTHEDKKQRRIAVPDTERARPAVNVGFFSLPAVIFRAIVESWSFFNVSPHVARQSYRESPQTSLGERGENLAVVLHRLRPEAMKEIALNLRGAVPGFKGVEAIQAGFDGRWAFTISEDHLPSDLNPFSVSDGTIRLLTLMVIANEARSPSALIAIEEPENGVHPNVHEHIVDVFREASSRSQVIFTTHNPGFLSYAKVDEVLMCGKVDGATCIKYARTIEDIDVFTKRFDLGDLFVQGILEGVFE